MISQKLSGCPTCADCPMFSAFEADSRGRGLCKLFDRVTRNHHEITQDCQNNLDEVEVILHSHEAEVDEHGNLIPAAVEVFSFFMPPDKINHETVINQFRRYADEFKEFYLYSWLWLNDPTSEF